MNNRINKMQFMLYVIDTQPQLTQSEMAIEIGIGETTFRRWIEMIEDWFEVKLQRTGSARKGQYKIISWGVLNPAKIREKYSNV